MSMEVTSAYAGYATGTYDSTFKKNSATKGDNSTNSVDEYYEILCKKFPQISFNTNRGLISGDENKIAINLSYDCLKKMANDPEFAKKVEFNLTGVIPGHKGLYAKAKADGVVIHGVTTVIDSDGNASVTCGGMTTANTGNSSVSKAQDKSDSLEEHIRKKREEKEEMEARLDEKRRKKEEFEERLEEMRQEREAYLEHFIDGNSSLKQYQSAEIAQVKSYFDTNA